MNHKSSMDDGGVVNDLKKAIRCQENDEAKKLIESILDSRILKESEGSKDISILMFAAIYSIRPTDIIIKLIKKCPQLVTKQRKDGYRGQTVLHILINRGQLEAVETVLNMAGSECSDYLMHVQSKGKHFEGTAMMGQLPLSVAALTFNKEMVDLLLIWGADISEQNSKGDTVLHSLIRYSNLYPEKHTKVESMMDYLNENLVRGPCAGVEKHVWRIENKEELTALQLAANLSTSGSSLFSYIFNLKGVYCHFDDSDGMFNSFEFDITEIDTMGDWERRNQNLEQASSVTSDAESKFQRKPSTKAADLMPERFEKGFSVLEMVCELKAEDAFPVLKNEIVEEVVKQKWDYYLLWFISFLLLHLGLMILVTIYAVYKAEIICYQILAEHRNDSKACQEFASVTMARREEEQTFVLATSIVLVLPEMALVAYESLRLYHKPPKLDLLFERNAIYRVLLVFLAVCLMMDNVWFWVAGVSNNFFLILALLVGWWFMIFFLRPFKLFSFFTVMMQKVLVGDMARFFCFIIFEFIAFSAAMYILYVPAPNGPPEEFKTVQATIMTMFQLMLGLADLQVLSDSSIPWLTTLLFVFFVLLTYALMLNALIALMSCTCSGVAAKTAVDE
ncbi:transient receptor potential cation channel subfamily V member 4-like [Littorina saxatilis]|uniref:transient receptor potential cation channel subfamily V member 4-like n=1 Tax=Littorina saxatilis TaxID=31220 RepID=UPI0038B53198